MREHFLRSQRTQRIQNKKGKNRRKRIDRGKQNQFIIFFPLIFLSFFFLWLTKKRTKEHNSIMKYDSSMMDWKSTISSSLLFRKRCKVRNMIHQCWIKNDDIFLTRKRCEVQKYDSSMLDKKNDDIFLTKKRCKTNCKSEMELFNCETCTIPLRKKNQKIIFYKENKKKEMLDLMFNKYLRLIFPEFSAAVFNSDIWASSEIFS